MVVSSLQFAQSIHGLEKEKFTVYQLAIFSSRAPNHRAIYHLIAQLVILLSALITNDGVAAEVAVRLDPETIEVQQSTTLTVTIEDGGGVSFEPDLPDGLQIVSRQQMQNHSWINGTISRQDTFAFQVVATESGTFELGPFTIKVGDQNLVSNAVSLTVLDASNSRGTTSSQSASRGQCPGQCLGWILHQSR